jgi:DNA-binding transcriptional regulator YiaG
MKTYILCARKENYKNYVDETIKEEKCFKCNSIIIYGDLVLKQANENKKIKNNEIKFICNKCYLNMPKFGKLIRPSQEVLQKMRQTGINIDEVSIREVMKRIKNKEYKE